MRTHLLYVEVVESLAAGESADAARAEMHRYYLDVEHDESPVWLYLRARLAKYDADREDLLEQAIARDSSFHWAYLSLARLWRGHGRLSRAMREIDRALFARASFPEARLERAEVLVEVGRYIDAADDYANYLRLYPGDRSVSANYARLLVYQLGRTKTARAILERQLEDDPENAGALMDLAAVAWKEGEFAKSAAGYREVLRIEPGQELAVLNLGNLHYEALWRGSEPKSDRHRESWKSAQKAYLFYLGMADHSAENKYDFFDNHLAVPHRLREISELIGEYDGPSLALEDL